MVQKYVEDPEFRKSTGLPEIQNLDVFLKTNEAVAFSRRTGADLGGALGAMGVAVKSPKKEARQSGNLRAEARVSDEVPVMSGGLGSNAPAPELSERFVLLMDRVDKGIATQAEETEFYTLLDNNT
jgi:hypothetical protein